MEVVQLFHPRRESITVHIHRPGTGIQKPGTNDFESNALEIRLVGLILNVSSNISTAQYSTLICCWILQTIHELHTSWTTPS